MSYKPYKGKDKYHIRVNKKIKHPAIIVAESDSLLYGYNTTSSNRKMHDRRYHKLSYPLNKHKGQTYVCKKITSGKKNSYSKPYNNTHLSNKDELYIDYLESIRKNKK